MKGVLFVFAIAVLTLTCFSKAVYNKEVWMARDKDAEFDVMLRVVDDEGSPPFLSFAEEWLHATNAVTAAQVAAVRDRILADGIPAQTFAAGANETGGVSGNYNYQGQVQNGWPRTNGDWRHSDLKNVAYFYVWKLFEKIRKVE